MYRDIKFQHAPGLMGLIALGFLVLPATGFLIRIFSTVPPLLAHVAVLRETRGFPVLVRALASAFFLVSVYVADGNAVWPTVVMSALALPIAALLSRRRTTAAGLTIGAAILLKQTAAYLLFLAVFVLLFRRRFREACILLLSGAAPYLFVLAGFALAGAGRDMVRWTIEVPFVIRPAISYVMPGLFPLGMIIAGFLPLVVEAVLEKPEDHATSSGWLLVVATGLALIALPRFDMLQTVASIPPLAVGAARLMRRKPAVLSRAAALFVANFVVFRAVVLVVGSDFDGRILFWNDEPAFELLIEDLRRLPPATPLHSKLWNNVLPRTGLLPPGAIYVNPWFPWFFPVDRIGERIEAAARAPGTVIVAPRGTQPGARRLGPYAIFTVPVARPTAPPNAGVRRPLGRSRP